MSEQKRITDKNGIINTLVEAIGAPSDRIDWAEVCKLESFANEPISAEDAA